jgi:hypothetical protein
MKKGTIALFGLAGVVLITGLLLSGCLTMNVDKGGKIDESATQQIEKGKTTRNEILKWFGVPDRTIGADVTEKSKITAPEDEDREPKITVGKNQEIYVYEYSEVKGRLGLFTVGGSKKKNTLMIWIDKDSGIVQDYGYKKEI